MKPEDLARLASQSYTRVPVTREVLADLETPVSTYLKLARGPCSYLLESVHGGEKWGRYSIIGMPCREVIKVYGHEVQHFVDGVLLASEQVDDPLAWIDRFKGGFRTPDLPDLPPFAGGLVGYFGYDTVRYVEKRLAASCPPDELHTPDILLMVSEDLLVFDNLKGSIVMITHVDPAVPDALDTARARLDRMAARLPCATPELPTLDLYREPTVQESDFVSGFTRAGFEAAVEKIKQYVLAGDVMQVVPSQRLTIPFRAEPINLYRALRRLNPSPYMYFLDLGDFQIVGSSPEILARLEHGLVTVRPIAGTRRRGHTEAEDLALEQEMVSDPKEIAEHLMLIDLGRNDIGRVAVTGSVEVTEHMRVERYSHVMHIVSEVTGRLRDGLGAIDVLRATHPAGTLSGAPKIRAMEIIDELEPVKRGVYGGAVGYLSWSGNMDTAIAIRTAVIKDGVLNIQAGAGIVADSQPALEWKETMNKARAMFRAVAMVTGDREGA